MTSKNEKPYVRLSIQELENSHLLWIYLVQRAFFSAEIKKLEANQTLESNNQLIKLNPFLDNGLVRVGGRLKHSLLDYEEKHPLIIPFYETRVKNFQISDSALQSLPTAQRQTFYSTNF